MNELLWGYLFVFFATPLIAFFDWVLFRKYLKCEKCGYVEERWYSFLVPTFIEVLCLFVGTLVGSTLR